MHAQSIPLPFRHSCADCGEPRDLSRVECSKCGSNVVLASVIDRRKHPMPTEEP